MEELRNLFEEVLNENLDKLVFGAARKKSVPYKKILIRPVMLKGELAFQTEFTYEKKVLHENGSKEDTLEMCMEYIVKDFKQVNIFTGGEAPAEIQVLAANPASPRITRQSGQSTQKKINAGKVLAHNRTKQYIIPDGEPCDFLIELGVMGQDGKVFQRSYAKFRQINRYLEIVADSLKELGNIRSEKPFRIIDFGCGKAYLTFALYYYLKVMQDINVEITGLDLKQDVIDFCEKTARKLGYDGLSFLHGDIADYESDGADMVVTLHACDTATDYALINAVRWHSRIILSVPCCQHELFKQIKSPLTQPMFKHGILKERFTEILTDGLRGLRLEYCGYDVAMIEFTSLEHTARNIMIKAVLTDPDRKGRRCREALTEYEAICNEYHLEPTTSKLK